MPDPTQKNDGPIIGAHRSVTIPDSVVQHTVQQFMVHNQLPVVHLSNITMHESHEPVHAGLPALVQGPAICFAPGAFQPHSESGRKLIEQQFDMIHPPMEGPSPIPVPYPNSALNASATPFSQNVLISPLPNAASSIPMGWAGAGPKGSS